MFIRTNTLSIPPIEQDNIAGTVNSVRGVLTDFLTPILTNIVVELTRVSIINIHWLISGNATFVASNLGGGRNGHLTINMTAEDYLAQMVHIFVTTNNPRDYPKTMGTAQEQALRTKRLRQNQALFQCCTAIDRSTKNKIVTAVQPIFMSPLMDQFTGFGQCT